MTCSPLHDNRFLLLTPSTRAVNNFRKHLRFLPGNQVQLSATRTAAVLTYRLAAHEPLLLESLALYLSNYYHLIEAVSLRPQCPRDIMEVLVLRRTCFTLRVGGRDHVSAP